MYEIIPDLWISKTNEVVNISNSVNINCSKDLSFLGRFKEYKTAIKKNIIKHEIVYLNDYTISTIDKIHRYLENNQTVVISCVSCIQLSPLICIAYLIKYGKLNKINAIELFKTKNETVIEEGFYFNNILKKISDNNINESK